MTTTDPLVRAALGARAHAHCPYSGFAVGCAVLAADGTVVTGANVENASFTLGLCAERVAVFAAVTRGIRSIERIAIVTDADHPVYPCGACRQILYEFAPDAALVLATTKGREATCTVRDLLPHPFGAADFAPPAPRDAKDRG
ncbi:MAG: cytidine deaminase [Deltaproteobacteria bacterium]|nr:MAG: cytidine deaminase [Deltaproteobacteria bacterium]